MSLPKEPRQKMINIMYLVLTALLALNVSRQIVHAFVVVNTGLVKTNTNTVSQNNSIHDKFNSAWEKDKLGTQKYKDAADLVTKQANEMVDYIQNMKSDLIAAVDKPKWKLDKADTMLQYVDAKEDFTTPTGILLGDGENPTGKPANLLKVKLGAFRKSLISIFANKEICVGGYADTLKLNLGLLTPGVFDIEEGRQSWEYYYFGEAPLVSDVVTFTKLQADVRNAEAAMLNYLYSGIGQKDVKVSKFVGKILPASTYVLLGDSFKADIFPTAVMKTLPPRIEVGDTTTINVPDIDKEGTKITVGAVGSPNEGIGKYAVKTDKEGPQTVMGLIRINDPVTGKPVAYPFSTTYVVAKASVTISPSQMNVFYAGIPNPVDISAAGFDNSALHPSMNYGSISPSGPKGHYMVNVSADAIGKEANIVVSANMPDGSHKQLPPQKFRIKRIPDPTCFTGGKSGDASMSKLQIQAVPKVEARMPADFDFGGVNFTVISFSMSIGVNGVFVDKPVNGGRIPPDVLNLINQAPKGGYIIVKNVQVKGPDGKARTIQGMAIRLN
jgi:gliding motility-associated protein GldM